MIKYYNTWLPDVSEQAILWRLHTTGEVLLLVMKEIAPRRLQLETVTAFGVRVSSWSIWGTTPCTANLSMTWRSVRRMNSSWMATRSSASKPAVRDQRPCLGRTELTEMKWLKSSHKSSNTKRIGMIRYFQSQLFGTSYMYMFMVHVKIMSR